MATFPQQHWAKVWRPSLRLGGVRLPGHYIGTQTLATLLSLIFHFSLRQTFYADSNGGCPRPWTKLLSPVSYLVWLAYGLKTAGLE